MKFLINSRRIFYEYICISVIKWYYCNGSKGYVKGERLMNNLSKIVIAIILMMSVVLSFTDKQAEAANSKVYKEYSLSKDYNKFPIKLTNGLTIGKEKYLRGYVPVILKDKKKVWIGGGINSDGDIQFTVTENKDTFLYHKTSAGGTEVVDLVGVHADGKVFLEKYIPGSGVCVNIDFLSASTIELGIERYNKDYNDQADRYTGIYDITFYSLSKDGKMTVINYVDKEFVDLLKKGKLKGILGNVGMTYESLKTVTQGQGIHDPGEINMYSTTKATYGFFYGKSGNKIASNHKVAIIMRDGLIKGTEKEISNQIQKYLDKPIGKTGDIKAYKAGKYYLAFEVWEKGTVRFYIGTKDGINALAPMSTLIK